MDKNKDTSSEDFSNLLSLSNNKIIATLFVKEDS